MDEPTSKVIVAAIGLVQSAMWPAVLLWVVYRFHNEIAELIKRLQSGKVLGSELIFNRVEHLQAELQKTNLVVGGLTEQPNSPDIAEAAKKLLKPPGELVAAWAREHGADNPWDMGPRNWERCLFDLGYAGGKRNELVTENGKLKNQ